MTNSTAGLHVHGGLSPVYLGHGSIGWRAAPAADFLPAQFAAAQEFPNRATVAAESAEDVQHRLVHFECPRQMSMRLEQA